MDNTVIAKTSVEADSLLPVEQQALAIRDRASAMIKNASLDIVRERMPEYVPIVEQLISSLDVRNPLTLAQVGSWALEEQADAGLELLSAVQQGPGQKALLEVDQFEQRLRERVQPLEGRLNARNAKAAAQSSWLGKAQAAAISITSVFKTKKQRRAEQSKALQAEMQTLSDDSALLAEIVVQTVADTVKMKTLLVTNRDVPAVIEKQVASAMGTHAEAAEKLFLSLVAVNEFQGDLEKTVIPELEKKAQASNALDVDIDAVQRAKEALGLLETRRTDLMAAFLNTCLQRGMIAEMGKINASSAIEMERLQSIALPQMLGMLGNLALQQRTGELVASTKAANQILSNTTESMAKGFGRVLELSKQADQARLKAAESVVSATKDTLAAVGKFREHEANQIQRQKAVQAQLAQSVGDLRSAAARIGKVSAGTPSFGEEDATALAVKATGVAPSVESVAAVAPEVPRVVLSETPAKVPDRPVSTNPAASLYAAAKRSRIDNG